MAATKNLFRRAREEAERHKYFVSEKPGATWAWTPSNSGSAATGHGGSATDGSST